jgi:putative tryptophan/tyrosine transport system substrate-binding protein
MRRREFITLVGGAAAAWPLAARAQQPVIGFLRNTSADASANLVAAFRQSLSEVGYAEGQNLAIEYRWSDGRDERLPTLAAELVRRPVAVFVAANNTALVAAKAATETIPIVFVTGDDPVQLGFVTSLSRPAGNITGVSFYSGTLGAKQVEFLHEIVPRVTAIGMLVNPGNPAADEQINVVQVASRALGLQIYVAKSRSESDFDPAFALLTQQQVGALLIGGDALFNSQGARLAAFTALHALPAIHFAREYVAAGGLMSYGSSVRDAYRQVGVYVGRLLRGAKPADLPVMLPTKFELAINLKTAKALGLTIAPTLLDRADEVIE